MKKDNKIMVRVGTDLEAAVQAIADVRFEGNRSAAIRWMLHQARISRPVADEIMRQEREHKAEA